MITEADRTPAHTSQKYYPETFTNKYVAQFVGTLFNLWELDDIPSYIKDLEMILKLTK